MELSCIIVHHVLMYTPGYLAHLDLSEIDVIISSIHHIMVILHFTCNIIFYMLYYILHVILYFTFNIIFYM